MFFFDKLFPVRKLGSRRNYPHFFSGSEQEKEGEKRKKEKKTKWEKSQRPIKIRLNVVPKKDLIIIKHGCFFYNWHPSNRGKHLSVECHLYLGIARLRGGGLNPCPDGLGHFFKEEFSKFKWAFA